MHNKMKRGLSCSVAENQLPLNIQLQGNSYTNYFILYTHALMPPVHYRSRTKQKRLR